MNIQSDLGIKDFISFYSIALRIIFAKFIAL
ncbi:hypothetical protein ME9_00672 [Bartonella taylorii 8TBB]|uniref:Uncharacterized protein n=1 Tax=Bartonella taylorii 8TBB TaxID=1094560 RepID=A0A9P2W2Z0_BARTA|nr:hypothetical protein ME9_00672 [Bartonella taylorii 8TBB]OPB35585.1 hypothetical protein Btaycd_003710 [Bartonella taylorii]